MPAYDYACENCKTTSEHSLKIAEKERLSECLERGQHLNFSRSTANTVCQHCGVDVRCPNCASGKMKSLLSKPMINPVTTSAWTKGLGASRPMGFPVRSLADIRTHFQWMKG